MEVFRPELHAYGMRALVDLTRDAIGPEGVAQLLRPYGVTEEQLVDPTGWVSLEFAEAFLHDMVERCKDTPDHLERAAALGMTPKYLGPLAPLFFIFGSPVFTYKQQTKLGSRFNRTGTWTCDYAVPGRAQMTFKPNPAVGRERTPYMCRCRIVQQCCVPVLFNCPRAKVEHPSCIARGDAECVYRLTWDEPQPRPDAKVGLALGAALAAAIALATGLSGTALLAVVFGTSLLGFSLGRILTLRADLAARVQEINEHNEALDHVSDTNDERFAELLQAKAEVEQKVELRTAELRSTSQRLSETLQEIQALDRAKTDFFNNVSHELRTPLTLILAPLEALLAGREPPGGEQQALETMQRNGQRLLRLINQLLDLAKIDAGEMRVDRKLVDLPRQLRALTESFDAALAERGIALRLEVDQGFAPIALDWSWIESALTNLVANSLRFVQRGGHVRLRAREVGDRVTIDVEDDGPGMSASDAARIFERFAQGGDTHGERKGTGLGLAIVREAARLHGGDVTLRTAPGEGATFTLHLPRSFDAPLLAAATATNGSLHAPLSARKAEASELLRDTPAPNTANERRAGPSSHAALALVVEDNDDLRNHIADVLATRYRVSCARDGEEGLELARKERPVAIVSDVAMPRRDGLSLCRALREDEATRDIPFLLVTARSDHAHVLQGFEAGASDYVVKPFNGTELLARVDVHVRLRSMIGQLARQERLAAIGSLAASVAHHVRNPLSALISGLPAMRNRLASSLDASTLNLIGIMIECAERIERMTLDLLDLSRVDREQQGDFRPGSGLIASTRILSSRISGAIDVRTEIDEQAVMSGRPGELNHVFLNLIDNALRAVGERGTIEVKGAIEHGAYVVRIADSGAGIDPALVDRIFEPFWTTRAAGEGTGLGLSIAKEIVEEHGGSIHVEPSAFGGTLFTVRLPLAHVRASELAASTLPS